MLEKPEANFIVGGTIPVIGPRAKNVVYIRRPADEELYENCLEGKFSYILTSRQMGKSSLVARTVHRLREHEEENVIAVMIDITSIGTSTVTSTEAFYQTLITQILDGLPHYAKHYINSSILENDDDAITHHEVDFSNWWTSHSSETSNSRFNRFLEKVILKSIGERKLVIFVDEVDALRSLSVGPDDFFAQIRSLDNQARYSEILNRLTFILIGCARPEDLIQDPQRTPFNSGERIELRDIAFEDAIDFARGLDVPVHRQVPTLERIFHWTNGHPYLTCKLCYELKRDPKSLKTDDGIDRKVRSIFLARNGRDTNINQVESRIKDAKARDQLLRLLYRIYSGRIVDKSDEEIVEHIEELMLAGIVIEESGHYKIRNKIYREYFDASWMDQYLSVVQTNVIETQLREEESIQQEIVESESAARDANEWVEVPQNPMDSGDIDYLVWMKEVVDEPLEDGEESREVYDPLTASEEDNADEPHTSAPTDRLAWLSDHNTVDGAHEDDDLRDGVVFNASPSPKEHIPNNESEDEMYDFLEIFQRISGIYLDNLDEPPPEFHTVSHSSDSKTSSRGSYDGTYISSASQSTRNYDRSEADYDHRNRNTTTSSVFDDDNLFDDDLFGDDDDFGGDDDFALGDDDLFADDTYGAGFDDFDSFADDEFAPAYDFGSEEFYALGDDEMTFRDGSRSKDNSDDLDVRTYSSPPPPWVIQFEDVSNYIASISLEYWPLALGSAAALLTSLLFVNGVLIYLDHGAMAALALIIAAISLVIQRTKLYVGGIVLVLPIVIWFGISPPNNMNSATIDTVGWWIILTLLLAGTTIAITGTIAFGLTRGNMRATLILTSLLIGTLVFLAVTVMRVQTEIILGWYTYPAVASQPSVLLVRTVLLSIATITALGSSLWQIFVSEENASFPLLSLYFGVLFLSFTATIAGGISVMTVAAVVTTVGAITALATYIVKEIT